MDRHYEPVIVFSFSKRDCEAHALAMSKLDFTDGTGQCSPLGSLPGSLTRMRLTDTEKRMIGQIFSNAIDSLSDDDKHLPQVVSLPDLMLSSLF